MVTLLHKLLGELEFEYPCLFSLKELGDFLDDKSIVALKQMKVLRESEPMQSAFCPSCDNEHEAHYKEKEPYLVCSYGEYIPIDKNALTIFEFDIPRFLELTAKELKIKSDVKSVAPNDLWLMGSLQKDSRHFLVFYSRTDDINSHSKFFDAFKPSVRAFIIFTNTETPLINLERAEAVVVPIADMIELKKNSLAWDAKSFQEQIITAFRQVAFYSSNGDFVVLGKTLGNITPSSPEYFFAFTLWENFNQPVSHESIFSYCKEQLGKQQDYTDTAQAFCNKMKSNIKKQLKNGVVDKIIVSTKTPNGSNAYKMTNPK